MKSYFEERGGTYTMVGDFLIPDLVLDEQPEGQVWKAWQDAAGVPEEMEEGSVQRSAAFR